MHINDSILASSEYGDDGTGTALRKMLSKPDPRLNYNLTPANDYRLNSINSDTK